MLEHSINGLLYPDSKLLKIRELQCRGVLWEMIPAPHCWRFRVNNPLELPSEFIDEYRMFGEIRW